MTVRPYTSVYWNVDVLYRLYPYILSPYSPPTQIPYCMHSSILYSYSATFTRNTTPILNFYRLPFYSYSFNLQSLPYRCAEEISKLQPDARRGPRDDL